MLVTSDSDSEASFRVDFGRDAEQDFIIDAYCLIQLQQRRASFASTSHAWQLWASCLTFKSCFQLFSINLCSKSRKDHHLLQLRPYQVSWLGTSMALLASLSRHSILDMDYLSSSIQCLWPPSRYSPETLSSKYLQTASDSAASASTIFTTSRCFPKYFELRLRFSILFFQLRLWHLSRLLCGAPRCCH